LSRALGMTVVAEGVETIEELLYLHGATGIHYAQGFYFAKPMFLEQLLETTLIGEAVAESPGTAPRIAAIPLEVA
jgi:cyclic di-GMP phosphodiesterase Gmr